MSKFLLCFQNVSLQVSVQITKTVDMLLVTFFDFVTLKSSSSTLKELNLDILSKVITGTDYEILFGILRSNASNQSSTGNSLLSIPKFK